MFKMVSEAQHANRWLQLEYRDAGCKRSKIEVIPFGIPKQGSRQYLICRCGFGGAISDIRRKPVGGGSNIGKNL